MCKHSMVNIQSRRMSDSNFGCKVGDRVFAFHQVQAPHGSYAEYALAWAYNTSHLPSSISFEG